MVVVKKHKSIDCIPGVKRNYQFTSGAQIPIVEAGRLFVLQKYTALFV